MLEKQGPSSTSKTSMGGNSLTKQVVVAPPKFKKKHGKKKIDGYVDDFFHFHEEGCLVSWFRFCCRLKWMYLKTVHQHEAQQERLLNEAWRKQNDKLHGENGDRFRRKNHVHSGNLT